MPVPVLRFLLEHKAVSDSALQMISNKAVAIHHLIAVAFAVGWVWRYPIFNCRVSAG